MGYQSHSSTIAIAEESEIVAVIKPEAKSLSIISTKDWSTIKIINLNSKPTSIAYDGDIEGFFIGFESNSSLLLISSLNFEQLSHLPLDQAPTRILTTKNYLLVTSKIAGSLDIYDKYNLTLLKKIHIGGSPSGITYISEKDVVYVPDLIQGMINVISLAQLSIINKIDMGSTATLTESIIFDENYEFGYVPQTYQNTDNQNLQFDTAVFPSLSIINLKTNENLRKRRLGLDIVDQPVGIPLTGLIFNGYLFIANYASNDLSILYLDTLTLAAHIELGFTPFGLATDKKNELVLVNNTLDETISIIDGNSLALIEHIKVAEMDESSQLIQGQRLFNNSDDPRLAKDQWIACATCHFEGGNDGASWFFPDGKRNTPSLFNSVQTAPFHWNGDLNEIQDVEFTIQDLMAGHGLSGGQPNCTPNCLLDKSNAGRSDDLDALAIYVNSLQFPIAFTQMSALSNISAYTSGKAIFESEETECITCHTPPNYTDNKNHLSDLSNPGGLKRVLNTPSLLGLRDSAPYLHDGSAKTLSEVLQLSVQTQNHGKIKHLTNKQSDDLLIFLENIQIPSQASITPDPFTTNNSFQRTPKNPLINLELTENIWRDASSSRLQVDLTYSSNLAADLYLAFFNRKTNDFIMVGRDGDLNSLNTIVKYRTHGTSEALNTSTVVNLAFEPNDVLGLSLDFYAIAVSKDTSIIDSVNWLSSSKININF